jgi:hypothetical protein
MKNRANEWTKNFVTASGSKFTNGIAKVEIPEHIRRQNYRAGALISFHGEKDDNAVVEYDGVLQTFFLHAFENKDGVLLIWLGAGMSEFPTPNALIAEARRQEIVIEAVYGSHATDWGFEPS